MTEAIMVNEKSADNIERQVTGSPTASQHEKQQEPAIKLTTTRFIIVLIGLALAIFLVMLSDRVREASR